MLLKFTNTHIFYATEAIWPTLDYRFKYLLHEVITANPDDDYIQEIDVPEDILIQIFSTVTIQPEGLAAYINQDLLKELMSQIQPQANIAAAQAGKEEPNEAARILLAISSIDAANRASRTAKIEKGKKQILT